MSKRWRRDQDGNLTLYWEPPRFRMPDLPLLLLLAANLVLGLAAAVINHWI